MRLPRPSAEGAAGCRESLLSSRVSPAAAEGWDISTCPSLALACSCTQAASERCHEAGGLRDLLLCE